MRAMRWDIFCHVVDNLGDIGVCWRLACQLAGRSQSVRLWVDDARALAWMAPGGDPGVELRELSGAHAGFEARDVVVAAFGCELPETVTSAMGRANVACTVACTAGLGAPGQARRRVPWINLEYLSAQDYVERSHGLASPVAGGPALYKWFYFPGFTAATGGLLREPGLQRRQAAFDRGRWLAQQGIEWKGETVLSLFCYEPAALARWLEAIADKPVLLLVSDGRAAAAVRGALAQLPGSSNRSRALRIVYLRPLAQEQFDHLLWSADCNFVRGEDSLVRALWAGIPLVWQAYPQQEDAHQAKVGAFLDWLNAPPSLRRFHEVWNGLRADALPLLELGAWGASVRCARARLLEQEDLVSGLLRFVAERR